MRALKNAARKSLETTNPGLILACSAHFPSLKRGAMRASEMSTSLHRLPDIISETTVLSRSRFLHKEKDSDDIIHEEKRHPQNYKCNCTKIIVRNNSTTFSGQTERLKTCFLILIFHIEVSETKLAPAIK
jgi:hypothetical protein